MKKFISILMVFAMLFSLTLPAMAEGSTTTIYFDNTNNWEIVYACVWDDSNNYDLGSFPGTAMTQLDGNIWSVEVPARATYILFNDGSNQTADLTIPTDGSNLYTYNSGWSTYAISEGGGDAAPDTDTSQTEGDVIGTYTPTVEITGMTLTVGGVTYTSGNATYYTPENTYITIYGTNLQYATDDHLVTIAYNTYEGEFDSGSVKDHFSVSEDGSFATCSNLSLAETNNCELKYSNDGGETWIGSGIYVTVSYESAPDYFDITYNISEGSGSVILSSDKAAEMSDVTVTFIPDAGYEFSFASVDGPEIDSEDLRDNKYTFQMDNDGAELKVYFRMVRVNLPDTIYVDLGTIENVSNVEIFDSTHYEYVNLQLTNVYGSIYSFTGIPDWAYSLTISGISTTIPDDGSDFCTLYIYEDGTDAASWGYYSKHKIIINESENGTVTANTLLADAGETITLTVTPGAGYKLSSLTATYTDADNIQQVVYIDENYNFIMQGSDVTITATFVENTDPWIDSITLSVNGTIHYLSTVSDPIVIYPGDTVVVTATGKNFDNLPLYGSDDCTTAFTYFGENNSYMAKDEYGNSIWWEIESESSAKITLYHNILKQANTASELKFTNDGGLTEIGSGIYMQYVDKEYTVSVDSNIENGSISVDSTTAHYGDKITVTASPAAGYKLDTITVTTENGTSVAIDRISFVMPASNVTVSATFKEIVVYTADIAWGSMSFTYKDTVNEDGNEIGWTCDTGSNVVIVTNNGSNAFSVTVEYIPNDDYYYIDGTFDSNNMNLLSNEKHSFVLTLNGKPQKALTGETIGVVSVIIDEPAN